jgi:hypothetical protein
MGLLDSSTRPNNAKGGFMSIAEPNDAAALDQSTGEITADCVRIFMRDVSVATMCEVSNLISELETLRERLAADGARAEREIMAYARLGRSATELAAIASQSMVDVKAPAAES